MEAEDLHDVIEAMRDHLHELVSRSIALTDPRVVAVSQRLDKLLSQAQYMKKYRSIRFAYRVKMHNWILRRWFRHEQPGYIGKKKVKSSRIPVISGR